MRNVAPLLLLFIAIGCATGGATRPAGMSRPEAQIRQTGSIFFGSGSEAPAFFEVDISNTGEQPLTVRRIRVESPGMAQWSLVPLNRVYRETIAPGGTKTLALTATAVTRSSRPVEPLSVRVTIDFEAEGKSFREMYTAQASSGPY
jgi:hypothetical protein